jgi:hypothetical protein
MAGTGLAVDLLARGLAAVDAGQRAILARRKLDALARRFGLILMIDIRAFEAKLDRHRWLAFPGKLEELFRVAGAPSCWICFLSPMAAGR